MTGQKDGVRNRILVVEDDGNLRGLLLKVLAKEGYEAAGAADGRGALEHIGAGEPDAILLDQSLPGMTGRQLLDALAERGIKVPFLVMTGQGDERLAVEMMKLGASDYLIKDMDFLDILPIAVARMFDVIKTERALRESEERFRGIVNHAAAGYFFIDRAGCYRHVNAAWLSMHGYDSPDEVIGRHFSLTQTERDLEAARQKFEALFAGISILCGELSRRGRDGRVGFHTISAQPVIRSGEIVGAEGFLIDTTERKRAEEAMEKRLVALTQPLDSSAGIEFEDLFNPAEIQRLQDEFAQAAGVASIITRPDGTPLTAPSGFCRLCKDLIRRTDKGLANCFRSDAALGRPSLDGPAIQPCMSGGLWDAGAAISVGGRHVANWLIGQVRDSEQTEEKIRVYAREIGVDENSAVEAFHEVPAMSRLQFEKVARALFTLANQLSNAAYQNVQQARFIADRKRAEAALHSSELQLANAVSIARLGPWELDIDAATFTFNDAFYAVLRTTAEREGGYTMPMEEYARRFLHPDDVSLVAGETQKAIETHDPHFSCRLDHRIRYADGEIGYVSVQYFVVKNEKGRTVKTFGVNQDITDRKKAEEERERIRAQLTQSQKMESVGRLAGGVAHDFNNMLGVILGHAEMALAKVGPAEPLRTSLEEIQKAAERSADLTRQLLAFARKQTIAPRLLDLNGTVEGMLRILRRLIGEDIDLAWLPGRDLWPVKMDPVQIDQILANLCVNARDAIAGPGRLTIETGNVTLDEGCGSPHADLVPGEYVLLTVSDNGCGIDAETLPHIFEPFFSTKELGKGTGLGLATVHGIVKQNDGFIHVFSEPGQGTAFKIYLPCYRAKEVPEREESGLQAAVYGSGTILLVEDEPAFLNMTTKMLVILGYTVITARTPGEAIRLAREYPGRIDLVLTDVVMPEMNGRDLVKNMLSVYPGIRRLFMSGYTSDVIAHQGVLDQGVPFLQKPYSMNELGIKVREVLAEG